MTKNLHRCSQNVAIYPCDSFCAVFLLTLITFFFDFTKKTANMLKFLILCVILSQDFCKISAVPSLNISHAVDTAAPTIFPSTPRPDKNDTNIETLFPGNYNFHATHQTFYVNSPCKSRNLSGFTYDNIGEDIRSDYTVTNGIGAHKIHRRKLTWNGARKICVEEGAHLAIIRTEAENKIIRQMMQDESIEEVWVGYHDKFEEGHWVTVLDEPIVAIPWSPWSKKYSTNPDNYNENEHCAVYLRDHGGLNDLPCLSNLPFICKISTS